MADGCVQFVFLDVTNRVYRVDLYTNIGRRHGQKATTIRLLHAGEDGRSSPREQGQKGLCC